MISDDLEDDSMTKWICPACQYSHMCEVDTIIAVCVGCKSLLAIVKDETTQRLIDVAMEQIRDDNQF